MRNGNNGFAAQCGEPAAQGRGGRAWLRALMGLCLVMALLAPSTRPSLAQHASVSQQSSSCETSLFREQPPDACTNPGPRDSVTVPLLRPGFQVTTVFSGLTNPTVMQFSPDGRIFVAEKRGIIKVFDSLTSAPKVFADLRSEVDDFWDRGVLGLALAPNFPTNPYVYVLYAYDAPLGSLSFPTWNDACPTPPGATTDGCTISGRLSRLRASGDSMTGSEQVLINDWCQQFPSHSAGTLAFGPDGALYATAGDGAHWNPTDYGQFGNTYTGDQVNPCGDPPSGAGVADSAPTTEGGALRAQSLRRAAGEPVVLGGTVIRVDPATGTALPDNPNGSSSDPNAARIVAYGLRNPFRATFRPGTSQLWIGDVGSAFWEEIDRLDNPTGSPPLNFGWPCYEGAKKNGDFSTLGIDMCTTLYTTPNDATAPFYAYKHTNSIVTGENCPQSGGASITGLAFYTGNSYPSQYNGALFFEDNSRQCIWDMKLGTNGEPDPSTIETFISGAGSPVDIVSGPNGDLFYLDFYGGLIKRIQYTGNPITATASASPTSGVSPLTVQFDGTKSTDTDPASTTMRYSWDLNGDGTFGDSTDAQPSYTYDGDGDYTARLQVTDDRGTSNISAPIAIHVGNEPPTPTITSPVSTLKWKVGQTISFSGSATDPQDGAMAPSALTWEEDLHHCPTTIDSCHVHILQTWSGVSGGSFSAPDHEYPSYLELRLTATDSAGLQTSTSVRLDPQTVVWRFTSYPGQLKLAVNGVTYTTPFSHTLILGARTSRSAPQQQLLGKKLYQFGWWANGGPRNQTGIARGAASFKAYYRLGAR